MKHGKFQYYTATTIDGFIADENHSLDWLFEVKGGNSSFADFFAQLGAFVMGRSTFDWIVKHEDLLNQPEKWKQYHGDLPCWVFTHRPLPQVQGASIRAASGDIASACAEILAAANGKNVWLAGGGQLVGSFFDAGFLDELILQIAPVTLGKGAPLLPRRITSAKLELIEARQNGPFIDARYSVIK